MSHQRIKIAFVADTINKSGMGGVISGRHFVDRLRERHEVIIVGADPYGAGVQLKKLPINFTQRSQFYMAKPDRQALRDVFKQVDIVHLQYPFWLSFVALDEARKAGKPVIAAFHVQPENILYNLGIRSPWISSLFYRYWIKNLWNKVDLVICPSHFAEKKLKHAGLITPTTIISNGVLSQFPTHTCEKKTNDYFLILMVGRLASEKQQAVLIKALKQSRYKHKIKLVIAGRGYCEKKLLKLAKSLPNDPEIGYVNQEQLIELMTSADLFVHCSEVELEGIAVLEAMYMGLPVLVAEGPETACSEFSLDLFRYPVGDVDILSKKIDWIIEHPDELVQARNHSYHFSGKLKNMRIIEQLEQAYLTILGAT